MAGHWAGVDFHRHSLHSARLSAACEQQQSRRDGRPCLLQHCLHLVLDCAGSNVCENSSLRFARNGDGEIETGVALRCTGYVDEMGIVREESGGGAECGFGEWCDSREQTGSLLTGSTGCSSLEPQQKEPTHAAMPANALLPPSPFKTNVTAGQPASPGVLCLPCR